MSEFDKNKNQEKKLDDAQSDQQDKVDEAASNPTTSGPAEGLREAAAKAEDKSDDSREPA